MKLEFPTIDIQKSEDFKSQNFDFGDKRVIMNILRSKMYSNPIDAICREIMSNSRDANREAGRADTPIVVELPTQWDDNIKFIDCGLGISPDRMENVFIQYGASTKRGDNVQTGGFGLGAKTPFAYSDTFTITTTTADDDGVKRRRTYIAYIDPTQLGAMSLVTTEEVNEEESTGTTIALAVKPQDIGVFRSNVQKIGKFWDVKPNVVNASPPIVWNDEAHLAKSEDGSARRWYITDHGVPQIIIDGIGYRLDNNSIYPGGLTDDTATILSKPIRIHFEVGELDITANREDLDYQPTTIEKIKEAGREIVKELRVTIDSHVEQATNLWEASIIWADISHSLRNLVLKPKWKGLDLISTIDLPNYDYKLGVQWTNHVKISVWGFDSTNKKVEAVKRYRSFVRAFHPSKTTLLVEDSGDNERPNKRRLQTLFEQNPAITRIGVVAFKTPKGKDKFQEDYSWSELGAIDLATIPKAQNSNIVQRGGYTVHRVKKLVPKTNSRAYKDFWEWAPEDTRSAEDNLGGTYVILKGGKITLRSGVEISKDTLSSIQEKMGENIYGMLYKWRKAISDDWTDLQTSIEDKIKTLEDDPDVQAHVDYGEKNSAIEFFHKQVYDTLKASKWKNPQNPLAKWIEISGASKKGIQKYELLQFYYDTLGIKTRKTRNSSLMGAVKRVVLRKYPMILPASLVTSYNFRHQLKKLGRDIVDYVNNGE